MATITPNGTTPSPAWPDIVDAAHARAHATNSARRDEMHKAGLSAQSPDAGNAGKKFVSIDRPPDTQSY